MLLIRLSIMLLIFVGFATFAELGLRIVVPPFAPMQAQPSPEHVLCDVCPYVYTANPAHPGIDPIGIRTFRASSKQKTFVFVGDSITFGPGVSPPSNFVSQMAQFDSSSNYINAGVRGYNTFTEISFLKRHFDRLRPKHVVLQFCMNDIADPLLHWTAQTGRDLSIPRGSIPNLEYHDQTVLPKITKRQRVESWRKRLRLFDLGYRAFHRPIELPTVNHNGKVWPTHLTLEDTKSIETLTDRSSPEWNWLDQNFSELRSFLDSHRVGLTVLIVPLAYQLDPEYPIDTQNTWRSYCSEKGLDCLDLLPAFRQFKKEELFLLQASGYDDIWHLTEKGHSVVAIELAKHLANNKSGRLSASRFH